MCSSTNKPPTFFPLKSGEKIGLKKQCDNMWKLIYKGIKLPALQYNLNIKRKGLQILSQYNWFLFITATFFLFFFNEKTIKTWKYYLEKRCKFRIKKRSKFTWVCSYLSRPTPRKAKRQTKQKNKTKIKQNK